uniref:Uncharacterized protein n=1 Tax=Wuchereria bancrofti TaxID=6293 RepID=A0AAF5PY04_WUCBA
MHACRHACGSTHLCACLCTYLFHFRKKFCAGRKEGATERRRTSLACQHAKIITEEKCRFWRLLNTDGALDDIFSGKTVSRKRSSQLYHLLFSIKCCLFTLENTNKF